MESEWEETSVGTFCPFKYGKGLPEKNRNKNGNVKVYGSNGAVGVHDQALVDGPGIIIGRKGTIGTVTFSPAPFWPIDTTYYITTDSETRDLRYTYYLLKSLGLERMNADSAVPGLNRDAAHAKKIKVCPLPEQCVIARILSSLDDKIELNRQMNATLEAIAQALFTSWFVDFAPVLAKAGGQEPAGMDAETAALFPDGFEVMDGREVPVGWSVGALSSVADILSGGTPKTSVSEYWDGGVPWVTAKDVTNNSGGFIINTERKITDRGVSESSTRWLKKGTTIITARGSVGECALLGRDMTMNQTCYGLRGKDEIGSCFVYLMTINKIQELKQQSYGTIFDTITRKTFNEISVVIPPKELLKQFEDIILPLFQSILKNTEQSRTLAALRDTLLPKLISGEVRVPDVPLEATAE